MKKLILAAMMTAALAVSVYAKQCPALMGKIDEAVKTDPAGSGYEDWRGNVEYLKGMIEKRHARAVMLRDAF